MAKNDEKSRTCVVCNRVFTKRVHMENHLPTHDPDRQKYECPNCDQKYNDKKNWRKHFLTKHVRGSQLQKQKQLQNAEEKLQLGPAQVNYTSFTNKIDQLNRQNEKLLVKVIEKIFCICSLMFSTVLIVLF